ncbi:hypothetical protein [Ornithinimicrobium sp. INDO-MA30-4]|nr:hypothetical protein [Ornithinimicrobium sp. INDO-MA30-4]UJH70685.1 hypothetical protein L0A91_00925 [Ornithinimicrobium sp. INDO-MA30-4]
MVLVHEAAEVAVIFNGMRAARRPELASPSDHLGNSEGTNSSVPAHTRV